MASIVQTDVAEPVLELLEFANRSGQQFTRTVNAGTLFRDLLHLLAEVRDRLPASPLVKKLFLEPRLFVQRLGQKLAPRGFLFCRISRRRTPGSSAAHAQLRQRIRTQPVRPVGADRGGPRSRAT